MKPLLSGYARRRRLHAILPFVRGDVLDLGCGWLHLPDHLTEQQGYVGVDVMPAALEYNAQRYPGYSYYLCDLDTEPLSLGDRHFEVVTMVALLEHLHSPERILSQIPSLLEPEGLLLITTPSPLGDWVHRLGSRIRLFYPEAHVQHVRIYDRRALEDLLLRFGYQIQHFRTFLAGTNQLIVCQPPHHDKAGTRG